MPGSGMMGMENLGASGIMGSNDRNVAVILHNILGVIQQVKKQMAGTTYEKQ